MPLQFLQQVRLQIGTAGNFQHFEDRRQRDVVLLGMLLVQEKGEFLVEVFQTQQGANTLVERVFVNDQNGVP